MFSFLFPRTPFQKRKKDILSIDLYMCIFYFTLFAYSIVQALYYQLRAYLLEKREMDDGQGGETDALGGGGGDGGGGGGVASQGGIISSAQHASDLIVFLRQTHPLLAAGIEAILQEVTPPLPLPFVQFRGS